MRSLETTKETHRPEPVKQSSEPCGTPPGNAEPQFGPIRTTKNQKSTIIIRQFPFITPQRITLRTLVAELRGRGEAISGFHGGSTYYHEELAIFRQVTEEKNLFLPAAPKELTLPPVQEGNEHQVWCRPHAHPVIKATWPDFFGLLVIHRQNEERQASPSASIVSSFAVYGGHALQIPADCIDPDLSFLARHRDKFGFKK